MQKESETHNKTTEGKRAGRGEKGERERESYGKKAEFVHLWLYSFSRRTETFIISVFMLLMFTSEFGRGKK